MIAMRIEAKSLTTLGVLALLNLAAAAYAEPQAQMPSGLVIYPRIEVRSGVDTEIYLGNTSTDTLNVYCVYTNGLSHCSGTGEVCQPDVGCAIAGQACVTECSQTDFLVTLTPRQILSWQAGVGLASMPLSPEQTGLVPPAPSDPFIGQLRCLEVDADNNPVARNDLVGSASTLGPGISAAGYEAVGVRSTGVNDGDTTLCLGANSSGACTTAEYATCPDSLVVNHFFEDAFIGAATVENRLTLVPCTLFYQARPGHPAPDKVTVGLSLVVYNEFEQPTTTSLSVTCFRDIRLASYAAFTVAVQGTLAGQIFVTGSQSDPEAGPGLVGVVQQTLSLGLDSSASAHGLTSLGTAARADPISLVEF